MYKIVRRIKNRVYSKLIDVLHELLLRSTKERFTRLPSNPLVGSAKRTHHEKGILITTFEKRQFDSAIPLIAQIRDAGIGYPIMLFLNGNLANDHDKEARKKFLEELSKFDDVNVISSYEMTGISRNWNLGIQLLGTTLTLCLSDDLVISKQFKKELELAFDATKLSGFLTIEGFAAFIISRPLIDQLGWFDERFMGFGEEDGDYVWRYIKKFGQEPPRFKCHSLLHQDLQTRGEEVAGVSKYSLFNLVWRKIKYKENENGIYGSFTKPQVQVFEDFDYHPMETFRASNKDLFFETDEEIIQEQIRKSVNNHKNNLSKYREDV